MREKNSDVEAFLPLTAPVFHVMLALADEPKHGYAILKEVDERTHRKVQLSSGTLYAIMKRLLNDGLIEEIEDRRAHMDERRRSYRLTRLGRRVAEAEARRMEDLLRTAAEKRVIRKLHQGWERS
jgi:DNA-binding PadR family transcriptional regulator